MYLSKSKYCNALKCNKLLWLEEHKPEFKEETTNLSVFENGNEVGELAKELFGFHIDIKFNDDLKTMINDTKNILYLDKVVITEASFSYNNNFCSVDILKKENNNYEIYEVKSSTNIKQVFIDDISYQVYVLTSLGYNITKASIVYINDEYVYHDQLDIQKLFKIEDVTDIAFNNLSKVEKKIKEINSYMEQQEEPEQFLSINCLKPYDCPFFKYCTSHLAEYNIFTLHNMRNNQKFELYNKGLFEYKDLLKEEIDDKSRQQIEYELYNKKPYINKEKIKEFLNTLSYPLYFLDFETFQISIPKYNGAKPYMQIPFQYSLHYYEKENTTPLHKEFLAMPDIDPRRELALSLTRDIPKNVCVLAYNMSFEKTIIRNLASLYPDLKEHLMNIHDNIKDLMVPFKERYYYTKDMHGSFSIKYVLPALYPDEPSLNYHNLDLIHNGSEAMNAFKNMGNLKKIEQEELRKNLLEYCKLDTYAMVKILSKLKEKIK